jgi:hypothetical protein
MTPVGNCRQQVPPTFHYSFSTLHGVISRHTRPYERLVKMWRLEYIARCKGDSSTENVGGQVLMLKLNLLRAKTLQIS